MQPNTNANPAKRHRGNVACRRCRRLRVKCIHDASNVPPCEACRAAGSDASETCAFPRRGETDIDRKWRSRIRPPQIQTQTQSQSAEPSQPMTLPSRSDIRSSETPKIEPSPTPRTELTFMGSASDNDEIPLPHEVIEAVRIFTTSYFQLGFIPKTSFFERVRRDDVSDFLVLTILCLSARFTPCLVQRYGSGSTATERFMAAALERVSHEMYNPCLETIQAFFLLSIAEWGNGDRDKSAIHMGIAVRMAAMMKLHREETYYLPPDADSDQIIYSEAARRTFWMIQSQDNLHSGHSSPLPFSCDDITALLPCEESDFSFGIRPAERAALPGTPPALSNPMLVNSPRRSLFATLIQSHSVWGQVARRACRPDQSSSAGPNSEYISMAGSLKRFEEQLPAQHKWSVFSLNVWKDLGFELAYLSVVMMLRLSNILSRRMYLENIKASISTNEQNTESGPTGPWKSVSDELFENVVELYQQIDASFAMRVDTEGYPAILVFPVYVCGSLALNLWQCPQLCSQLADRAATMLMRCLQVITDLQHAWPMARRWQEGLQQAATPLSAGPSPASVRGLPMTPHDGAHQLHIESTIEDHVHTPHVDATTMPPPPRFVERLAEQEQQHGDQYGFQLAPDVDIDALPNDLFDAEVTAFLQGDLHFGLLDEWNHAGFSFH